MYPVVLNYNIRSKQIIIEHNIIQHSYSYIFHPHRAVVISNEVHIALWK